MNIDAKDIFEWDTDNWSKGLELWSTALTSKKLSCLEIGARKGGPSLFLASLGHQVKCSDVSPIEHIASPLHSRYAQSSSITYEVIDATNIPYEEHFDIVVFKSVLGGIARNNRIELAEKVIHEIHKSLKPGGKLIFAENLKGSVFHRAARSSFRRWGSYWNYLTLEQIVDTMKPFSKIQIKPYGCLAAFALNESQRHFLSSLDEKFDHLIPNSCKYIVFGVAEKSPSILK